MSKQDTEKIFAFLCYFATLIGIIIVLVTKDDRSDFSIYHCKQGIVLLITWVILGVISVVLAFIPIFGWILAGLLYLAMFALYVLGIINSLTGKKVPLPVIGQFAEKFNF